jgi:hypothetical protein
LIGLEFCEINRFNLNYLLATPKYSVHFVFLTLFSRGNAVVQLVEAMHYKLKGCGFDSLWCHWKFSLSETSRPHYDPGVVSASDRNEYQEYFLGQRRLVPKADKLTIFKCRLSWNLGTLTTLNPQGLPKPVQDLLYLYLFLKSYPNWSRNTDSLLILLCIHSDNVS